MTKLLMIERRNVFRAPTSPEREPDPEAVHIKPGWGLLVLVWAMWNGLLALMWIARVVTPAAAKALVP